MRVTPDQIQADAEAVGLIAGVIVAIRKIWLAVFPRRASNEDILVQIAHLHECMHAAKEAATVLSNRVIALSAHVDEGFAEMGRRVSQHDEVLMRKVPDLER